MIAEYRFSQFKFNQRTKSGNSKTKEKSNDDANLQDDQPTFLEEHDTRD